LNKRARSVTVTVAVLVLGLGAAAGASAQMAYGGGYGMMGRGYGRGYGTMGGHGGFQGATQVSYEDAMRLLDETRRAVRVDKAKNEVFFSGKRISIAMAAVDPGFEDTTFEVAGLVNPTIVVPAGSEITLTFVNMDYGADMPHGVVITPVQPPYPPLTMMGMPYSLAGVPILAPRSAKDVKSATYAESSTSFPAPQPGSYYYLCQYYDHASKGMYGRFVVVND